VSGAAQERRLTNSPNAQYVTDWSRDGRHVLYHEIHPKTGTDLWLIRTDVAHAKPEPFLVTPFSESDGAIAPNGKWLAYTSNESGRAEVYVQPLPSTGAKWLASQNGGSYPRWRADGLELFYVGTESRLKSVDVKARNTQIAFSPPRELFPTAIRLGVPWSDYDVSADGSQVLLLAPAVDAAPPPLVVLLNWRRAIGE
jgi:Tol biopolymer transport system component